MTPCAVSYAARISSARRSAARPRVTQHRPRKSSYRWQQVTSKAKCARAQIHILGTWKTQIKSKVHSLAPRHHALRHAYRAVTHRPAVPRVTRRAPSAPPAARHHADSAQLQCGQEDQSMTSDSRATSASCTQSELPDITIRYTGEAKDKTGSKYKYKYKYKIYL
jgi:hypothetical protein